MKFLGFCSRLRSFSFLEPSDDRETKNSDPAKPSVDDGPEFHKEMVEQSEKAKSPLQQNALHLRQPYQDYILSHDEVVPEPSADHELLVRVKYIGLNPIDWKAPAFGFGLPDLPCISGRDIVGVVIKAPKASSHIRAGDIVVTASTDYRDSRKAAFQQFAIALEFNVARIPSGLSVPSCVPLGVSYVTAILSLGICLGVDFSNFGGPDLMGIVRNMPKSSIPDDQQLECLEAIRISERPKPGDWLAIWGASSTVAYIALQLAKLAGLKVICIADAIKHGSQLVDAGADVLVHRNHSDEAVSVVQAVSRNEVYYGLDAVGEDTAALLQKTLKSSGSAGYRRAHLAGLTGLPKERLPGIVYHKVPIKMFHESCEVGYAVMDWLESLLLSNALVAPKTMEAEGGLEGVNDALSTLRDGNAKAQRIVITL